MPKSSNKSNKKQPDVHAHTRPAPSVGHNASSLLSSATITSNSPLAIMGVLRTQRNERGLKLMDGEIEFDSRAIVTLDIGAFGASGEWTRSSSLKHIQSLHRPRTTAEKLHAISSDVVTTTSTEEGKQSHTSSGVKGTGTGNSSSSSSLQSESGSIPDSISLTIQLHQTLDGALTPTFSFKKHCGTGKNAITGDVSIGNLIFPLEAHSDVSTVLTKAHIEGNVRVLPRKFPNILGPWQNSLLWNMGAKLSPKAATVKLNHRGALLPTFNKSIESDLFLWKCFYAFNVDCTKSARDSNKTSKKRRKTDDDEGPVDGGLSQLYKMSKWKVFQALAEEKRLPRDTPTTLTDVFRGTTSLAGHLKLGLVMTPHRQVDNSLARYMNYCPQSGNDSNQGSEKRLVEGTVKLSDSSRASPTLHSSLYSSLLSPLSIAVSTTAPLWKSDDFTFSFRKLLKSMKTELGLNYHWAKGVRASMRLDMTGRTTEFGLTKKCTFPDTYNSATKVTEQHEYDVKEGIRDEDFNGKDSTQAFLKGQQSIFLPATHDILALSNSGRIPKHPLPQFLQALHRRHQLDSHEFSVVNHHALTINICCGFKNRISLTNPRVEKAFMSLGATKR